MENVGIMINHLTSTIRVLYDKLYQFTTQEYENSSDLNNNSFTVIDDCPNNKYQSEIDTDRLFPEDYIFKDYKVAMGEPTHIIDNLYLGSSFNAGNYHTLKKFNIKIIINVTSEIRNYFENCNEFKYHKFDILDDNKSSMVLHLNKTYDIIKKSQDNQDGNILIHCFMGKSRSLAIVLYYLLKTHKKDNGDYMTFDEALDFIKEKRTIVNPTHRLAKDILLNTNNDIQINENIESYVLFYIDNQSISSLIKSYIH